MEANNMNPDQSAAILIHIAWKTKAAIEKFHDCWAKD